MNGGARTSRPKAPRGASPSGAPAARSGVRSGAARTRVGAGREAAGEASDAPREGGAPPRGGGATPRVRSSGVKLSPEASRSVKAGHPWVYRAGLERRLDLAAGSVVPVTDSDGYLLGAGIVDGEGAIALRMVARDANFAWTPDAVRSRLGRAREFRRRVLDAGAIEAHRIVHGEADGFPGLAVDRYGSHLVVYRYAVCADGCLPELVRALAELEGIEGVHVQDRLRGVSPEDKREAASLGWGSPAAADFTVAEDDGRFVIDPSAPVSPGLFLDLREGRRRVQALAGGARVLNLFSFTGAFAVRAVRAGATAVTNVDAAPRSHARCRLNLAASGMDPEACEAITGDVFAVLERLRGKKRVFDLIVVDPPPFSSVKGSTFSAKDDWSELARHIAPVVAPGGRVVAVSNAAKLGDEELVAAGGRGPRLGARDARMIEEAGLPPDFPLLPTFPEGRYLKIKHFIVD